MPEDRYRVVEAERLPSEVAPNQFYYSRRFDMAALSCPCGCGHKVMLNLLDQHAVAFEDGLPTVCPSILVADAPCLSHFWIRRGETVWDEQWSKSRVERIMAAQIKRHLKKDSRPTLRTRFVHWVKSILRG